MTKLLPTDTKQSNFIRTVIERNIKEGRFAKKKWNTSPGNKSHHDKGLIDKAVIRTRFPPEPNGYLHIGHAKSIFLNFGLAQDYKGACHLRFDDTNPEKEDKEFVNGIIDSLKWLGFDWNFNNESNIYYASDYFSLMYEAAESLIHSGQAYVDQQTAEQIKNNRGTLTTPGKDSPWRNNDIDENLKLFREMKAGKYEDGAMVLRAKINMASPNMNLRDPAVYRIKNVKHHKTGSQWCIYPMYDFAHCNGRCSLEGITHSICTLEFEDQRPFYDWLLKQLLNNNLLNDPPPRQHEFSRLNLTHTVLSKRKL